MRMHHCHIEELREQQKRQKIKCATARAMIADPRLLWAFETECPDASKVEREYATALEGAQQNGPNFEEPGLRTPAWPVTLIKVSLKERMRLLKGGGDKSVK